MFICMFFSIYVYTNQLFHMMNTHSYGHLLVITGYNWDYTFYKWGFVSTYNWYLGP